MIIIDRDQKDRQRKTNQEKYGKFETEEEMEKIRENPIHVQYVP